jgi:hypothetical protein
MSGKLKDHMKLTSMIIQRGYNFGKDHCQSWDAKLDDHKLHGHGEHDHWI